jgi:hypothetical protein
MTAGITRTVTEQSAGTTPSSLLGNIGNALGLSTPAQAGGKRRRNKSMKAGKKSKKGGKKSKKGGKKSRKSKKSKKSKKSRKSRK